MRSLTFGIVAGVCVALGHLPASAQVTTRIETHPVYGATVTVEHGVRVYRPLPPQDRVIINPGGKTPLYLGIGEGGSYSQNYGGNAYGGDSYRPGGGYAPGGVGRFFPRGPLNHHHGR